MPLARTFEELTEISAKSHEEDDYFVSGVLHSGTGRVHYVSGSSKTLIG